MAASGDLIDFGAIETQKENIQSLPGGRSAKQLSLLCSPLSAKQPAGFTQTQDLKNTIRQDFEKELQSIDEADDPLEVYDRYVKWTTNAYPTAQATTESGLLPLVERATKSLMTNTTYQNDPRYLKIWLLYIKLFSDAPRETYAYLARHDIGERLALYYEEYAAWLENQGHWTQAEEVYCAGVDKEARPKERLLRKYAEFQHRREAKTTSNEGPSSPALPRVRPALVPRTDIVSAVDSDPQANDRISAQAATAKSTKPSRAKMTIFSDDDAAGTNSAAAVGTHGGSSWDSIGSIADRKKENTREPTSWAGEKLDGGKKMAGPKMSVFKDPTLAKLENELSNPSYIPHGLERLSFDARGRKQYVFANLECIYPNGAGDMLEEFCFEELRARKRGWLQKTWTNSVHRPVLQLHRQHEAESTCHLNLPRQSVPVIEPVQPLVDLSDENEPPNAVKAVTVPLKGSPEPAEKRLRREEKANKTRKIKIVQVEVKQEAQTIQLNLDSPSRPTKVRKKKPEATMTIHTKEAMNEVYDIFNQTLDLEGKSEPEPVTEDSDSNDDDDDDDDYTSVGESTGTGCISVGASEYGDETTTGDYTTSSRIDAEADSITQDSISNTDFSDYTNTNTNTSGVAEMTDGEEGEDEADLSKVSIPAGGFVVNQNEMQDTMETQQPQESMTPTSPDATDPFDQDHAEDDLPVYSNLPYRTGKAAGRLPFMTPIVEKTESSLGALTAGADKSYAFLKTPSRQNNMSQMPEMDEDEDDDDDEDATSLLSSPFQETTEPIIATSATKIPAPALCKLEHRSVLSENDTNDKASSVSVTKTHHQSSPIVPDAQCNPLDAGVRTLIISQIDPPLASFSGYSDHRGSTANLGARIRKYSKSVVEKRSGTDTTSLPPTLDFEQSRRTYTIRRELGRGAFAPVYLVDSIEREPAPSTVNKMHRSGQEVVKMEDPPTPWEFYIIHEARRRLVESRPLDSIVAVHEMHVFDDEGYLIEDFRNQGTLLDVINLCRAEGAMDELLAMFFVIELFRTVEAIHGKGIIHGDLKPDNILLRFDETELGSQYQPNGTGGWADKGVLLIDFGRGIDMRVFRPNVQFIADWKTTDADCAEMREMRPWTFQVDYHGLAGTVHSLLFGKYMETTSDRGAAIGAGAIKTYKIKEGLKRYWQTEIWSECFDFLLNPLMHLEAEQGKALPVICKMQQMREKMEAHLSANCEKGVGLKPLIRRLEAAIKERRR